MAVSIFIKLLIVNLVSLKVHQPVPVQPAGKYTIYVSHDLKLTRNILDL